MIAISSLSIVSAGLFDGLLGNSQNNIINIDDYQFNIPDGFELDDSAENYNHKAYWFLVLFSSLNQGFTKQYLCNYQFSFFQAYAVISFIQIIICYLTSVY